MPPFARPNPAFFARQSIPADAAYSRFFQRDRSGNVTVETIDPFFWELDLGHESAAAPLFDSDGL